MGTYVYRVTSERVMCSDGVEANVAEYAYKPYFDPPVDRKMHFKTGAQSSDNMAARGNVSGRIAIYGDVFENPGRVGSFYDDYIGGERFPRVDGVKADPFPIVKLWRDVLKKGMAVSADVGTVREADGINRCISAYLKRETICGMSDVFYMTCQMPGCAKPESHTISLAETDAARLHAHWAGFIQNVRARARVLYNLIEE